MDGLLIMFLVISFIIVVYLFFECWRNPKLIFFLVALIILDIFIVIFLMEDHKQRIVDNQEPNYFPTEEAARSHAISDPLDRIQLQQVGDELEFDFMTVNNDDEYKIGYNGKEDLKWMELGEKSAYFTIQVGEKNLIKRVDNKLLTKQINGKTYYKAHEPRYMIYVKPISMTGGTSEESCGKNCTREIETEIIK